MTIHLAYCRKLLDLTREKHNLKSKGKKAKVNACLCLASLSTYSQPPLYPGSSDSHEKLWGTPKVPSHIYWIVKSLFLMRFSYQIVWCVCVCVCVCVVCVLICVCVSSYYSKLSESMVALKIKVITYRRMKQEKRNTMSMRPDMFSHSFLPISVLVIRHSHPIKRLFPIHNGSASFNDRLNSGNRLTGSN